MAAIRVNASIEVHSSWLGTLRGVAMRGAIACLARAVTRLKGTLPKDTGRLRRNTRTITYARDERSFRIWSSMFYSRYVITAPMVWARVAQQLRRELDAFERKVTLRVIVNGERRNLDYTFKFEDLRPRVMTHALHRLRNEIRGTYDPVSRLRNRVSSAALSKFGADARAA